MNPIRLIQKRLAEADSCSDQMAKVVLKQRGLRQVRYDYQNDTVEVEYDPNLISEEQARSAIEPLLREIERRIPGCALRDPKIGICSACPSIAQHGKQWQSNGTVYRARFDGRVLIVENEAPLTEPTDRFIRRVKAVAAPAPLWRSRAFWEPILSALTLLMVLVGGLARWQGAESVANFAYLIAYLAGGYFGVLDGYQTLRERRLDVNFLMIAAALGAAVVGEAPEGATLLFLFSLSNTLQNFALARSRKAVRALMALQPDIAHRITAEGTVPVPVEELSVGDRVLIRPGERIPTDGAVVRGESHVDQSPITGESVPVHKPVGATVYAGTVNTTGTLEVEVSAPASATLLHRILRLVEEAQEQKARTQRWLEQFEQRYALAVIGGSALVAFGLPLLGWQFNEAFYRAMTLLVVASPCALVISTPATLLSAVANGARRGVLFKGGEPLERLASVKAIAIDKTGTLTEGKLAFTDLVLTADLPESQVWQAIADVESLSEHPLAQALVKEAERRGFVPQPVEHFQAVPGQGVVATWQGHSVRIGNPRLIWGDRADSALTHPSPHEENLTHPSPLWASREGGEANSPSLFTERGLGDEVEILQRLREEGKTAMLVAVEGEVVAVVAVADEVRPQAREAVQSLKANGVACVAMLTGDAKPVAQAVAQQVGVDRVYADLLPQEKLEVLKQLTDEFGSVAMVGDGVNDAPALASAEVGIAMGAGTDVALETADVALVGNDLRNLPYAVELSRRAMLVLKQNLIFATSVIVVLVILTFAANLRLPLGVVGHEGSTLLVVLNGLRLLLFRPAKAEEAQTR